MPSRFLAKGRGVIGLPLQQLQVATRVTLFERFCLIATELLPLRVLHDRILIVDGPSRSRGPCHVEHEKKTFFS